MAARRRAFQCFEGITGIQDISWIMISGYHRLMAPMYGVLYLFLLKFVLVPRVARLQPRRVSLTAEGERDLL